MHHCGRKNLNPIGYGVTLDQPPCCLPHCHWRITLKFPVSESNVCFKEDNACVNQIMYDRLKWDGKANFQLINSKHIPFMGLKNGLSHFDLCKTRNKAIYVSYIC